MAFIDKTPLHRVFAILSFACPLIAAILSWAILNSHEEFWAEVTSNSQDDANRGAGALMAFSEAFQILFVLAIGFFIGFFLAVISLVYKRTVLGFLGLALNLFPCIWIMLVKN